MDSFVIFQQLLVLFGLMALGFACTRRGWMNEDFNRKLSALVVNLFNPMIQLSGAVSRDDSMGGGLVRQNLILCCIYFGAAAVLAFVLAEWVGAALPWLMSAAAGCMVCVTAQEMIPEAVEPDEVAGVISIVLGFALMMALDVAL